MAELSCACRAGSRPSSRPARRMAASRWTSQPARRCIAQWNQWVLQWGRTPRSCPCCPPAPPTVRSCAPQASRRTAFCRCRSIWKTSCGCKATTSAYRFPAWLGHRVSLSRARRRRAAIAVSTDLRESSGRREPVRRAERAPESPAPRASRVPDCDCGAAGSGDPRAACHRAAGGSAAARPQTASPQHGRRHFGRCCPASARDCLHERLGNLRRVDHTDLVPSRATRREPRQKASGC